MFVCERDEEKREGLSVREGDRRREREEGHEISAHIKANEDRG